MLFTTKVRFLVGTESYEEKSNENSDFFEKEPGNLRAGIKILNLRKVFQKKAAVRNVTLNMYENHITVLLGRNPTYLNMNHFFTGSCILSIDFADRSWNIFK